MPPGAEAPIPLSNRGCVPRQVEFWTEMRGVRARIANLDSWFYRTR